MEKLSVITWHFAKGFCFEVQNCLVGIGELSWLQGRSIEVNCWNHCGINLNIGRKQE